MNEIIKKNGINFGIITGVVSVLITAIIYAVDINLFVSWKIGIVNILFYIGIGCYLLSKTKKDLKGILVFKDAFTCYFISAVVGILISTAFNIILFNFVDPGMKDTLQELTIKTTVAFMEKMGTKASDINTAIEGLKKSDQFSIDGLAFGAVKAMAFSALFGLILAAIFKSKPSNSL